MLSVIIPTHDPRWLRETLASVTEQSRPDVEIVVVPNGAALAAVGWLDYLSFLDDRIRVVPYHGAPGVGAVKRFGFEVARGDVLVELDHDDVLAPHALDEIATALHDSGADFAFSDFAEFGALDEPAPAPFGAAFGWESYEVRDPYGRPARAMRAFDPSPASLCRIWWAPNHVRAWTREGYRRAGGHDAARTVADDHDLLIRTYLTGRMVRIPSCLYFYRRHAGQTYLDRNAEIQRASESLYTANVDALARRGADLAGLPCFDLGGAHNAAEGWRSVDLVGGEVAADLRGPWPWATGSVGAFRAFDFLEHLPDKIHTMREIHRCLTPGGWLLSLTPSAAGAGADADPTHVSRWNARSFLYFVDAEIARYIGNTSIRFQPMRLVEAPVVFRHPWIDDNADQLIPYVTADLVALGPGYAGPGEVRI